MSIPAHTPGTAAYGSAATALPFPRRDRLGIAASGLCVAHCLLTPLLLAIIPLAGLEILGSEVIHQGLLVVIAAIALLSFLPVLLRGRVRGAVLALAMLGLGSLVFAVTGAEAIWDHAGETGFTVLGGGLMILAHWRNGAFCRFCPDCREQRAAE